MNSDVKFLLNGKIEVETEDGYYKSNIQDVTEEYIGISIPVTNGKYLPLGRKEEIRCIYYHGKDIYKFKTMVIGRKIDKILIIMLAMPEEVTSVQRRNFVRVPLMTNIYCALFSENVNSQNNQVNFFNAYSLDISGGGMRLAVDRKKATDVKYGSSLVITIPLQEKNLTVKGKVIRKEDDKKNPTVIYGISFVDVDKVTIEKIVRYVFEVMRDQMKKGAKGDL